MTVRVTHTKTYTVITHANPYQVCCTCGNWITGAFDKPGPSMLAPCGHESDYRDVCSSWSPVDGCRCADFPWGVDHGRPLVPAYEGQPF